jgi:SAM-dependent methyltransferase
MGTVSENQGAWKNYDWSERGDEWSQAWGGTELMWEWVVRPRIERWLPAERILEIAPGFGRWTQFIKDQCRRLTVVDVTEICIDACRERFSRDSHISYHVNDGKSLAMVPDETVDFAFSLDSLVHVDASVVEQYLQQLARKLTPDGVGFIHHSNMGEHRFYLQAYRQLPGPLNRLLPSWLSNSGWRDESMTANLFLAQCNKAGLTCRSQELITWTSGPFLSDCFSVFTRRDSKFAQVTDRIVNRDFIRHSSLIRQLGKLYNPEPRSGCSSV